MFVRSLSELVRSALSRKVGSRGRGRVGAEVLEQRCLLTEQGLANALWPTGGTSSGMPWNAPAIPDPVAPVFPPDSLMGALTPDPIVLVPPVFPPDSLMGALTPDPIVLVPPVFPPDSLMGSLTPDPILVVPPVDSLGSGQSPDTVIATTAPDSLPSSLPDTVMATSPPDPVVYPTEPYWDWVRSIDPVTAEYVDTWELVTPYVQPLGYDPAWLDPNFVGLDEVVEPPPFDWRAWQAEHGTEDDGSWESYKARALREAEESIAQYELERQQQDQPRDVPPDASEISWVQPATATVMITPPTEIVEGTGSATYTIQVRTTGIAGSLTVWVWGYYVNSVHETRELSYTPLSFDVRHTERTISLEIPEDDGWHPDNVLGLSLAFDHPDLTLDEGSVTAVQATVTEDDPYQDPDLYTVDYTLFWQTEEAALLRASPNADWYASWLPIYPPPGFNWAGQRMDELEDGGMSEGTSSPPNPNDPIPNPSAPTSPPASPPVVVLPPMPTSLPSDASPFVPPADTPTLPGSSSSPENIPDPNAVVTLSGAAGSDPVTSLSNVVLMTNVSQEVAPELSTLMTTTSGGAANSADETLINLTLAPPTDNTSDSSSLSNLMSEMPAAPPESSSSGASTIDSLSGSASADQLFAQSSSSGSVVEQLLIDGPALNGGSAPDPVLGGDVQLYVNADGSVTLAS